MPTDTTPTDIRLTLYVRSLDPRQRQGRQTAILHRLRSLAASGTIQAYDVTIWGRRLPVRAADAQTALGARLCTRLTLFGEWARRNGYDFEQTFPARRVDAELTGEHYEVRELPQLTLAEFHDDALAFLAPTEQTRIEERLDELEAGTTAIPTLERVERALTVEDVSTTV